MPARTDSRRDPRSVAERARADLKANAELGLAPPESPAMTQPSVTPETFGEIEGFKDDASQPAKGGPLTGDALTRARE